MAQFLAYFDIGLVVNVAIFVGTLLFSQKIKDFFNGVPSHLRSGLASVESGILQQVKTYEQDLVSKIVPTPAPVVKAPVLPPLPPTPAA